jgi:hypothetical protein
VVKVRLTIDIDNREDLGTVIFRGLYYVGKKPDVIRLSSSKRGYHVIWRGLKISEERSIELRKLIGDDPKRIYLDECSDIRTKQVLFSKKEVRDISVEEFLKKMGLKEDDIKLYTTNQFVKQQGGD